MNTYGSGVYGAPGGTYGNLAVPAVGFVEISARVTGNVEASSSVTGAVS